MSKNLKKIYVKKNNQWVEYTISSQGGSSQPVETISLYSHSINVHQSTSSGTPYFTIHIISSKSDEFTINSLKTWLTDNGYTAYNKVYSGVSGCYQSYYRYTALSSGGAVTVGTSVPAVISGVFCSDDEIKITYNPTNIDSISSWFSLNDIVSKIS